jgi:DNA (cytosine-5)-methyltransferase 1
MRPLTFGSLFAGVGGFDLGFERAGLVCKWQVEIDSFCQRVLAKHWPDVPKHDDVRTFPHGDPRKWKVDVICGGFPCQDLSYIGKGEGIEGDRSGLWGEYARVIRLLRPRFVVVENVPGILTRGLGRVLGDLAAGGYDAEWQSVPAAAAGADHLRFRFWLVAYAGGERLEGFEQVGATPGPARRGGREPAGVGAVPVLRELLVSDPQRARARMPLPAATTTG